MQYMWRRPVNVMVLMTTLKMLCLSAEGLGTIWFGTPVLSENKITIIALKKLIILYSWLITQYKYFKYLFYLFWMITAYEAHKTMQSEWNISKYTHTEIEYHVLIACQTVTQKLSQILALVYLLVCLCTAILNPNVQEYKK